MTNMTGEYDSILNPRAIAIMVAAILGLIALGIAVLRGLDVLAIYQTGWKALAQRFPAADVHKFGGRYKRQTGIFGSRRGSEVNDAFLIELAQEGFLVTPNFAPRSSILIPWSAIRDVSEINLSGVCSLLGLYSTVLVTVDYEETVKFHLPADALKVIHENVPAERFHKAGSFLELVKQRAANQAIAQKPARDDKSESWEDKRNN